MQDVVDALNEKMAAGSSDLSAAALKLRELAMRWQSSGPNTERMFGEDPELEYRLSEVWRNTTGLKGTRTGAVRLWPIRGDLGRNIERLEGGLETRVHHLFLTLVTNLAYWHTLAGPCARCNKYYLKKKASQTVYCSRACGNAATAAKRTRERFDDARKEKLRRVRSAVGAWERQAKKRPATEVDWRRWVAEKAEVDLRFIASAIRKEEIASPVKGK